MFKKYTYSTLWKSFNRKVHECVSVFVLSKNEYTYSCEGGGSFF